MFKVIEKYALAAAVCCVASSGSFGSNAQAVERTGDAPSTNVGYADLNLNTADGVEALYARLRTAARHVCSQHEGRTLINAAEWQACYDQALSTAVSKVKSESLSALHRVANTRQRLS